MKITFVTDSINRQKCCTSGCQSVASFTHALQPLSYLDITWSLNLNQLGWTLKGLYPASSQVHSPCNIQLRPCVSTASHFLENECVDDVSVM